MIDALRNGKASARIAIPERAGGRSCRLQSGEKRCGFRRFRCGGENRLLVGLEDGQPRREILRVIRARLIGDAEIGTEESGAEFGDQLLDCVGLIAETLAELAIATGLGRSSSA